MSQRSQLLGHLRVARRSTRWLRRAAAALLVVDLAGLAVVLGLRHAWEFLL